MTSANAFALPSKTAPATRSQWLCLALPLLAISLLIAVMGGFGHRYLSEEVRGWTGLAVFDRDARAAFVIGEADTLGQEAQMRRLLEAGRIQVVDLHRSAVGKVRYGLLLVFAVACLQWRRDRERQALAALQVKRAAEARFRVIFEQAPVGVLLLDSATGRITEVNTRFAEIVGRRPARCSSTGCASSRCCSSWWGTRSSSPNAARSRRLRGAHLLVVDDSAMNRDLVGRALALEGVSATLAADGQQVIRLLRTCVVAASTRC